MENKIAVYAESDPALGRKVKRALDAALRALGSTKSCFALYLVSDAKMKQLNRIYRRRNLATSVLSFEASRGFPAPETPKGFTYLGDVYLAPSFIERQGMDIRRLAIHGALHLLGYAHGRKRDRMKMEKEEERLVRYVINHHCH